MYVFGPANPAGCARRSGWVIAANGCGASLARTQAASPGSVTPNAAGSSGGSFHPSPCSATRAVRRGLEPV